MGFQGKVFVDLRMAGCNVTVLRALMSFRRVHVSGPTKEALNGAYETEPGNGGERDSYLKKIGIDTYLIVEKVVFSSL